MPFLLLPNLAFSDLPSAQEEAKGIQTQGYEALPKPPVSILQVQDLLLTTRMDEYILIAMINHDHKAAL